MVKTQRPISTRRAYQCVHYSDCLAVSAEVDNRQIIGCSPKCKRYEKAGLRYRSGEVVGYLRLLAAVFNDKKDRQGVINLAFSLALDQGF